MLRHPVSDDAALTFDDLEEELPGSPLESIVVADEH